MPKLWKYIVGTIVVVLAIGLVLPEEIKIPVSGATKNDWNHATFWYDPWGKSGVHKGIDIFGLKGTHVLAPISGVVLFTGNISLGGNVVAILGPKWKIHYLAHLEKVDTTTLQTVGRGDKVGTLGDSGNAVGKQPHVHYSIISLLPYPWLFSMEKQGWKKMFFMNPHEVLSDI